MYLASSPAAIKADLSQDACLLLGNYALVLCFPHCPPTTTQTPKVFGQQSVRSLVLPGALQFYPKDSTSSRSENHPNPFPPILTKHETEE